MAKTSKIKREMFTEKTVDFIKDALEGSEGGCIYGIDMSLSSFGVIVMNRDGEVVERRSIKPKAYKRTRYERFSFIYSELVDLFTAHTPLVISVERVASGRNFSGMKANAICKGILFSALNGIGNMHPIFMTISPSQLKKFATGNGRAEKEDMILAASDLGVEVDTDDEADALFCAKIVHHALTTENLKDDEDFKNYRTIFVSGEILKDSDRRYYEKVRNDIKKMEKK